MPNESKANDVIEQTIQWIAWQLFEYHCHNLSEEEAMWCKTNQGLQIRKVNGVCYFAGKKFTN